MRRTIGSGLLAFAAALPVLIDGAQRAHGLNASRLLAIPGILQKAIDAGELPGVVTLVWRRGSEAQLIALGTRDIEAGRPMAPDTIFRIASMSKPVTSAAA